MFRKEKIAVMFPVNLKPKTFCKKFTIDSKTQYDNIINEFALEFNMEIINFIFIKNIYGNQEILVLFKKK